MADYFNGLLSLDRKIAITSPGAYLVSSSTGAFPIFTTISNYENWGMANLDDKYIVLPGYKIKVYTDTEFGGLETIFDNTNGTVAAVYSLTDSGSINIHINRGSSCKLYSGSTQIGSS